MVHGIGLGFLTLVLDLTLVLGARAACYYPNGRLAPNDVPCQDDTAHATCCGPGYACLSNGICQVTSESLGKPSDTIYLRGSCTDQSWRSSSCPLFCIEEGVDLMNGGNGLTKCQNTVTDTYFCINRLSAQEASCEEGKKLFSFPGTPSVITTIGVAPRTTSSVSRSTIPPSSSRISISSSSSTTTDDVESSSSSSPSSSSGLPTSPSQSENTSGSPQSREPPEEANNVSSSSQSSTSNLGAIIGGTLGGTVAVILAGLGGWLLARKQQGKGSNGATGTASLVESSPFPPQTNHGGDFAPVVNETKPTLFELAHENPEYELPAGSGNEPSSGYRSGR